MQSSLCIICQQSLESCREADKLLITPFNPLIADFSLKPVHYISPISRPVRAILYKIGCYNSVTEMFYPIKMDVNRRIVDDIELSLPLCVWDTVKKQRDRQETICSVQEQNLNELPIENDYLTILKQLSWDT